MKKMVSFISALAMCAVMTAPMVSSATLSEKSVGADSTENTSAVSMTKEVASSYTVIIPDGEIDLENPSDLSVSAENVIIDSGQTLEVSVKSANNWKLIDTKSGSTASITYSLTPQEEGAEALTGEESVSVLSVEAGTSPAGKVEKILTAEVTGKPTMSGTYKDTLTFTVAVDGVQEDNDSQTQNQPENPVQQ